MKLTNNAQLNTNFYFIMNRKTALTFSIFAFCCYNLYSSNPLDKIDTIRKTSVKPLRVYNTTRLSTEKPKIDGKLDDACWQTGDWAGDFTQWIPNEGGKPSQPTKVKILYDDKNIYVAIRAYDNEPGKIVRKASRRDDLPGDVVGINFDSYHDHRTGFEFDVTVAGQKTDMLLTNPSSGDYNWNAVWYVKTGMEDSAWTAEFEIPLSQLRYSSEYEQVWGMHCWRWIDRFQEESDWEPQSSKGPGMLYLFGELHGIKGLPKSRRIEIMPYSLGRLKTFSKEPTNPFADKGRSWSGNIGLDAKIGITNNFTADLTLNPDFGQVESDPSVINLTAFETLYDEKRPFFLEGKNIFSFDFDDVDLFYSRRIGHSITYTPDLKDNEFMKIPGNSSILSAVKISGKTSKGLSIGALQSITAHEQAKIDSLGKRTNVGVEPLTAYNLIRVQQDFKQGNTMFGGIFTSTNRFIHDQQLEFMNRDAYSGGLDLLHQWHDKEFYVDAKIVGSEIKGQTDAITTLQSSSARYYQRPDAKYISFDSARTHLSGYGGRIKIGKGSKGLWRYYTEFNLRSPGLDLNDIGYMPTADIFKETNSLYYFVTQPVSIFRTYNIGLTETNNWDFGMEYLSSGSTLSLYLEFLNKWAVSTSFTYTSQALDIRILRGGYAMLVPAVGSTYFYVRTDPSKKAIFYLTSNTSLSANQSCRYYSLEPELVLTPVNTLKFSMTMTYTSNLDELQYIGTESVDGESRYILGKINQHTLSATFRVDYNLTPELSLQYYGSPFASVGKYSKFKTVTKPKASAYSDRFTAINPSLNGNTYEVSEKNNSQVDYSFGNPDFNYDQFRSNLVFRWEYRPGSQLYLVWSQDRTSYLTPGNNSVNDALGSLKGVFPNNVFLIKLNYWFSI
jgi:hypothetical protein